MPLENSSTGDSLFTRTVSSFALSIGTGLAFESLFAPRQNPYDPARQVPEKVDVSGYQECWINLTTLFRNIVGSVNKEVLLTSHESEFRDIMLSEMEVIDSLFQNEGMGLCKPQYYFCSYADFRKSVPDAVKFREDKTDSQKALHYKMMKTLELLMKSTEVARSLDTDIKPSQRNSSLIITHQPADLLSYPLFDRLHLLESHSGKLKPKNTWYTKFYQVPGADLSHLPFLRATLLVFGDRVMIHPSDLRLRRQIVEIAEKRQWTPMTTRAKMMMDLEYDIKEPYVVKFLKSLR